MPKVVGVLEDGKPIVDIGVSRASPRAAQLSLGDDQAIFEGEHFKALLDTGASISCVCANVARILDLPQFGIISMSGGTGTAYHPKHFVTFGFHCSDEGFVGEYENSTRSYFQLPGAYEVAQIEQNQWFDVIIGTDILKSYDFCLRPGGHFELKLI